jgi:hypothetical protein
VTTWLDPSEAALLADIAGSVADDEDWVGAVTASREYVEEKRPELFTGTPPVFVAGAKTGLIKLGTALLSNRWYTRMRSPLGASQNVEFGGSDFLRQDPDVAKMLGIGIAGRFVFGAAGYVKAEVEA